MFTVQDAIEHLVLLTDAMPLETQAVRLKAAVVNAARQFSTAKQWRCLKLRETIHIPQPFTAGTVSYNASTRVATFSEDLPSFALDSNLVFSGHPGHWPVWEVVDERNVLLRFGPQQNITDARFWLYKCEHVLPRYVTAVDGLIRLDSVMLTATTFDDFQARILRLPGQITNHLIFTVAASQRYLGRMSLYTAMLVSSPVSVEWVGSRMLLGDDLAADGWAGRYRAGAVSVSGVVVTGSETAFSQDMTGAILRLSRSNEKHPTGMLGINPPIAERSIVRVDNATHLVVDNEITGLTGYVKYTISSPIDLPEYAIEAYLRACELQFFMAHQPERVRVAFEAYNEALRRAKSSDVAYPFADTNRIVPVVAVVHTN